MCEIKSENFCIQSTTKACKCQDDDEDKFELNWASVGKVTFPQWEGNEGELTTSLSINYIQIHDGDDDDDDDDDGHDDDDGDDDDDDNYDWNDDVSGDICYIETVWLKILKFWLYISNFQMFDVLHTIEIAKQHWKISIKIGTISEIRGKLGHIRQWGMISWFAGFCNHVVQYLYNKLMH